MLLTKITVTFRQYNEEFNWQRSPCLFNHK